MTPLREGISGARTRQPPGRSPRSPPLAAQGPPAARHAPADEPEAAAPSGPRAPGGEEPGRGPGRRGLGAIRLLRAGSGAAPGHPPQRAAAAGPAEETGEERKAAG